MRKKRRRREIEGRGEKMIKEGKNVSLLRLMAFGPYDFLKCSLSLGWNIPRAAREQ